jgi:trimeric autotransporter adhesin
MKNLQHYAKPLLWFSALIMTALMAGCGGGDQGRGAILGLPAADLVTVAVTPATATIPGGGMQQFVATATYSDGTSRNVTALSVWASATTTVATVNSTTGVAAGVNAGTSAISAGFGGKAGSATLTVTNGTLLSIAVTPVNPSVAIGGMQQLVAMGTYSNGTTSNISAISSWTSATPAVATVTSGALTAGVTTGVTAGTAVMTASVGSISGNTTLTVTPAILLSIAITPVNPTLQIAGTQQLTVTATYSDTSTVNVTAMTAYASATPAAVTVGAATGLTTGIAAGTSLITGTFNGKTATTTVTVNPAALSSIAVTPATASILIGGTQAFVATGTYTDGTIAVITNAVTWSSGTIAVATVLPTGVATGLTAGTSVITASSGGKSGTANLTVTPAVTLSSINVTPLNPSALVGSTQQFTATGTYSDASTADITNAVVWSSGSTSVATILPSGNATAIAAGVSNITATQGVKNATTAFTVTAVVATINLGSAANFGVLAGTSITNNSGGTTVVTGDVGSPSQTVDPVQTAGFTNYKSGGVLTTALADLQVAITDANSRICDVNSAGGIDLGGQTFGPGVYCYAGAISITGTFTMNGPGLYIFRSASTLDTTANSIVALNGGATAGSVFWVPVGATTLGANSVFKGTLMGQSSAITLGDNASLQNGRVLTGSAATLRNNVISR